MKHEHPAHFLSLRLHVLFLRYSQQFSSEHIRLPLFLGMLRMHICRNSSPRPFPIATLHATLATLSPRRRFCRAAAVARQLIQKHGR